MSRLEFCKTKQRIIDDLNRIYRQALKAKSFGAALRAKELVAKFFGFLTNRSKAPETLTIQQMSDEDLKHLLERAQDNSKD